MKPTLTTVIYFIAAVILPTFILSCAPEPVEIATPPPPVEAPPPLVITIEESIDRNDTPPLMLYDVNVENLVVSGDEEVGIHFVYEITQPTGEATYLLNDPTDPSQGVHSDGDDAIIYRIVETVEKRIEDWGDPSQTQRIFIIEAPDLAYKIRYWVEVVTRRTSEITETEIMDVPYITVNDMIMQGGQILTIPE